MQMIINNTTQEQNMNNNSSLFIHNPLNPIHFNSHFNRTTLSPKPLNPRYSQQRIIKCCIEIDMVKTPNGIYAPKNDTNNKVVILWDLDNKPPRGPPYDAAVSLKTLATRFGHVIDYSAYANRHAFSHLPQWVLHQRRHRKNLDILERKKIITPSEPYTCGVCGRKCKTHLDLKKHFKQLHQREREKKLNRLKSLKGKKRHRFRERFLRGDHKYDEAARRLVVPKVGYGLAAELRRAGVFVKTVQDKPQAADWALKRQMVHSMSRGVDWLFLVSDDADFSEMLRRAREADLGTVVVGDWDRALGRHADFWLPWNGVENGDVDLDSVLLHKRFRRKDEMLHDQDLDHDHDHDQVVFFNEDEDYYDDEDYVEDYDDDYDDDDDEEDYDDYGEEEEDGFSIL